ncbi:MAG: hypothetical protein ABFS41_03225, partial [Myxococcota bacterium]
MGVNAFARGAASGLLVLLALAASGQETTSHGVPPAEPAAVGDVGEPAVPEEAPEPAAVDDVG